MSNPQTERFNSKLLILVSGHFGILDFDSFRVSGLLVINE